mmetsp:Transcript_100625/g.199934  ORF Transcript_100625/g.199934 Transcript_100625/m.199934 type:complete len:257 (-) Transcript_100625:198-968(-)
MAFTGHLQACCACLLRHRSWGHVNSCVARVAHSSQEKAEGTKTLVTMLRLQCRQHHWTAAWLPAHRWRQRAHLPLHSKHLVAALRMTKLSCRWRSCPANNFVWSVRRRSKWVSMCGHCRGAATNSMHVALNAGLSLCEKPLDAPLAGDQHWHGNRVQTGPHFQHWPPATMPAQTVHLLAARVKVVVPTASVATLLACGHTCEQHVLVSMLCAEAQILGMQSYTLPQPPPAVLLAWSRQVATGHVTSRSKSTKTARN